MRKRAIPARNLRSQPDHPRIELERVIEHGGVVAVMLRAPTTLLGASDTWLEITQAGQTVAVQSDAWRPLAPTPDEPQSRPSTSELKGKAARSPGQETVGPLLAVVSHSNSGHHWQRHEPFAVTIVQAGRAADPVSLRAETLTLQALMTGGLGAGLVDAFVEVGRADVAEVLSASCSIKPIDHSAPVRIRQLVSAGAGLVMDGLITAQPGQSFLIVSGDLQTWLPSSSLSLRHRPNRGGDVSMAGRHALASKDYEFVAVVFDQGDSSRELYVVELAADKKAATFYGPVRQSATNDHERALKLVQTAFGDIRSMDKDQVDRVYRPLLSTPKSDIGAERFEFGPPLTTGRPIASVVIPLYGDAFFLHCAHHLQRVLNNCFELVLVVDDPRIWPEISHAVALRKSDIRIPTSLVRNVSNYGFGTATNIGARLARGDVLFLMNSDVLLTDATPLSAAADSIRARRQERQAELVTGFSLLYEDQTIQHIGMEFRRTPNMGDLYTAEHPMKGMPFAFYEGGTTRHVQAVTAALLGISKDFFQALGGFDPAYERGDFEDADLCLKAREAGADILVHVHPGLYHLERQSIPSMGSPTVREMVTYMNCIEFNQRWNEVLSRPKRVHRIRKQGQAV